MSERSTETRKPLDGIRVLDFTRVLAGPYCTAMMADLGAEVIKIESPAGDDYRHVGPFRDNESLLFQTVNRGKRSLVFDLKDAEAAQQVRALACTADILIENFRPGVMDRLGLGADVLMSANPRLVYVSLSGFGQAGPNATRPAYDVIVQAMSGLMDLTGDPEGPPTMIGEPLADVAGGIFAAWGAMVALFDRERTGRGRRLDLALFDALVAMMPVAACRTLAGDGTVSRTGNRHALSAPFGTYAAGDGYFAVAVLNARLFAALCAAIGRPELAEDPRLSSDALRHQHEPLLAEAIEGWAAELTADEAVEILAAGGVPSALVLSARAAWASSQAEARRWATPVSHPELGELRVPEQPVHFEGLSRGGRSAAPALGADGPAILRELTKGEER